MHQSYLIGWHTVVHIIHFIILTCSCKICSHALSFLILVIWVSFFLVCQFCFFQKTSFGLCWFYLFFYSLFYQYLKISLFYPSIIYDFFPFCFSFFSVFRWKITDNEIFCSSFNIGIYSSTAPLLLLHPWSFDMLCLFSFKYFLLPILSSLTHWLF